MNTLTFLFILYFFILTLLALLKRVHLPGRMINLLRAFFPSWRFFEDLGEVPVLFYRFRRKDQSLGDWKDMNAEKPRRSWLSLALNAQGNLLLAYQSLLQHVMSELAEIKDGQEDEFEHSVSYTLVKNLVRSKVLNEATLGTEMRYQFKISAILPGLPHEHGEELLCSPEYEI
ncbi:MAG: hypothetical protein AB1540_08675 [Bdellovibrionota bacterium]